MSNVEKIVLVNPPPTEGGKLRGNISLDVFSEIKIPNAGIAQVHGVLKEAGYNVNTIDPRSNPDGNFSDADLEEIAAASYLGIGSMTRTRVASRELVKWYKERNPNGKVFAGGPDPTFMPELWLNEVGADAVMPKETERTLIEFFGAEKNGYPYDNIQGLYIKNKNGQIIRTPDRSLLTESELSSVALPYYPDKIKNNSRIHIVSGSRGCYGNCEFCSVINMYKDPKGKIKYRRKSTSRIIEEIMDSKKGKRVFMADDSFAPQEDMERAKDLMRAIINRKLNNRFYILQVEVKTARDKEFVQLAKKMGVLINCEGIESLNQAALNSAHKRSNVEDNLKAIKTYAGVDIGQHGMIVNGIKGDTPETVSSTMKQLEESSISTVQYFVETPLAGSQLGTKKEILPFAQEDTNLVDGQHVVSIPPDEFTLSSLQEQVFAGYKSFYTWKRLARLLLSPNNLKTFFTDPRRALAFSLLNFEIYYYTQQKLIPGMLNSAYTKNFMNILRQVDAKIAEEISELRKQEAIDSMLEKTGIPQRGIIFDGTQTLK